MPPWRDAEIELQTGTSAATRMHAPPSTAAPATASSATPATASAATPAPPAAPAAVLDLLQKVLLQAVGGIDQLDSPRLVGQKQGRAGDEPRGREAEPAQQFPARESLPRHARVETAPHSVQ